MNTHHPDTLSEARESFSGRILTDRQFNEAVAITDILKAEIHQSGRFKEKLEDYAHAFARQEKFDSSRANDTLRDIFKLTQGRSMNEMRTELMNREEQLELDEDVSNMVKDQTRAIGPAIKDGDKITFHRAYDEKAGILASNLGITNAGARRLMTETFREETGNELYDWGKEMEEKYYRPQIEAEAKERKSTLSASKSSSRSTRRSSGGGYAGSRSSNRRVASGPTR